MNGTDDDPANVRNMLTTSLVELQSAQPTYPLISKRCCAAARSS